MLVYRSSLQTVDCVSSGWGNLPNHQSTSSTEPAESGTWRLHQFPLCLQQRRAGTGFKQCELTRLLITWKKICCSEPFGYNGEGEEGFLHFLHSLGSILQRNFETQSDSMSDFCQLSSLILPHFQVIWIPWQPARINQAQKVFKN